MTLIVTVNGPDSIWLLADRRLSYPDRSSKDDARKIMFLETTDGVAILGYAGLGATGLGRELSDWMSAVLRGRNLPLEQSLGVLAEAMKQQLPRHMVQMPGSGGPVHYVMVPAFLGNEPKLYTIDLAFAPDRKNYLFRYTRHVINSSTLAAPRTPRLGITGSGVPYLIHDKKWRRSLLRVVRANDHGRISSRVVADHLANLNHDVHLRIADKSVGPRCIVAWRYRKGSVHNGGGGHQFYTGTKRDASSLPLPNIGHGMDMEAISKVLMPHFAETVDAMRTCRPTDEMDIGDLNTRLAGIPDKPDEVLP